MVANAFNGVMNATEREDLRSKGPFKQKVQTGYPNMVASSLSQHMHKYWRGLTSVRRAKNITACLHTKQTEYQMYCCAWFAFDIVPFKNNLYFIFYINQTGKLICFVMGRTTENVWFSMWVLLIFDRALRDCLLNDIKSTSL